MELNSETIHLTFVFLFMFSPCLLVFNVVYYWLVIKPNVDHPMFRMRRPAYLGVCLVALALHMVLSILLPYLEFIAQLDTTVYKIISGLMEGVGSTTIIAVRLWILWFDQKNNRFKQHVLVSKLLEKHAAASGYEQTDTSQTPGETSFCARTCFVKYSNFLGNSCQICLVLLCVGLFVYGSLTLLYVLTSNSNFAERLLQFLSVLGLVAYLCLTASLYDACSCMCFGLLGTPRSLQLQQQTCCKCRRSARKSEQNENQYVTRFRDDLNIRIELTLTTLLLTAQFVVTEAYINNIKHWDSRLCVLAVEQCVFHTLVSAIYALTPFYTLKKIETKRDRRKKSSMVGKQKDSKDGKKVKKQSNVSMVDLLCHYRGFYVFVDQLVQELAMENVSFLINLYQFKHNYLSMMSRMNPSLSKPDASPRRKKSLLKFELGVSRVKRRKSTSFDPSLGERPKFTDTDSNSKSMVNSLLFVHIPRDLDYSLRDQSHHSNSQHSTHSSANNANNQNNNPSNPNNNNNLSDREEAETQLNTNSNANPANISLPKGPAHSLPTVSITSHASNTSKSVRNPISPPQPSQPSIANNSGHASRREQTPSRSRTRSQSQSHTGAHVLPHLSRIQLRSQSQAQPPLAIAPSTSVTNINSFNSVNSIDNTPHNAGMSGMPAMSAMTGMNGIIGLNGINSIAAGVAASLANLQLQSETLVQSDVETGDDEGEVVVIEDAAGEMNLTQSMPDEMDRDDGDMRDDGEMINSVDLVHVVHIGDNAENTDNTDNTDNADMRNDGMRMRHHGTQKTREDELKLQELQKLQQISMQTRDSSLRKSDFLTVVSVHSNESSASNVFNNDSLNLVSPRHVLNPSNGSNLSQTSLPRQNERNSGVSTNLGTLGTLGALGTLDNPVLSVSIDSSADRLDDTAIFQCAPGSDKIDVPPAASTGATTANHSNRSSNILHVSAPNSVSNVSASDFNDTGTASADVTNNSNSSHSGNNANQTQSRPSMQSVQISNGKDEMDRMDRMDPSERSQDIGRVSSVGSIVSVASAGSVGNGASRVSGVSASKENVRSTSMRSVSMGSVGGSDQRRSQSSLVLYQGRGNGSMSQLQHRSRRYCKLLLHLPWSELPLASSIELRKDDMFQQAVVLFNKYISANAYEAVNISGLARNEIEFVFKILDEWNAKNSDWKEPSKRRDGSILIVNGDGANIAADLASLTSAEDIKDKYHFMALLSNVFDAALPDVFDNLENCFQRFRKTEQFKNIKDNVKY